MMNNERGVDMWTVVYIAQNKEIATRLQEILQQEGLLVKIRPIAKNNQDSDNYYEIVVPESEVSEAHSVIIEKGY